MIKAEEKDSISTKELSELLVQAISDEPFFTKDILIPKVRAIITGFRLKLATNNYNKIEKPSLTARLIRGNEIVNLERDFWRQELKHIVGEQKMVEYYNKISEHKKLWGENPLTSNELKIT